MIIPVVDRLPAIALLFAIVTTSACGGESGESTEADDPAATPTLASPAAEPASETMSEPVDEGEEAGEHREESEGEARPEGRESEEHDGDGEGGERDEHEGEGESHDEGGEGEEGGEYISREATWDATRRGARLVLSYDEGSDRFLGTVENTTGERICAVRVEVHLADGPELGPTARVDLAAGATTQVALPADGEAFEAWTAHPEVSSCS